MMAAMPVSNETEACLTRRTKDGRELLYVLKIIQQPERARACGSGAKSSADRRPVDPPPVVELKIYEGEEKKDVTFSHNANFFLFTTLEQARKIAHGRVPQTPAMAPVLTGAPVAGMVYLDRPNPAGYFIFPDLSVRHEGNYRLVFSLYEDVKEDEDADKKPACSPTRVAGNSMAPRAHVHFRLEVQSIPFTVYSAKKFPGLSESTPLSRQVAEQGCRVRIRRDIRVRRRDTKATEGYRNAGEESHYATSERYATPQCIPDRPRSISNGSVDARPPFNLQRRPSMDTPGYHPSSAYQPTPPMAPIQPAASYPSTQLSFGGASTSTHQTPTYQNSTMSAPLPPPSLPSASQNYPPPPPPAAPSTHAQYPQTFHSRQSSAPHSYNQQPAQQPPLSYGSTQAYHEESHQPFMEARRPSIGMSVNHEPYHSVYQEPYKSATRGSYRPVSREPYKSYESYVATHPALQQHHMINESATREGRSLTPINTNTNTHMPPNTLPSLNNVLDGTSVHHPQQPPSPASDTSGIPSGPQNPYSKWSVAEIANATVTPTPPGSSNSKYPSLTQPYSTTPDPYARYNKRSYENTFAPSHIDADEDDALTEQLRYRRANGTIQAKDCQTRSPPKNHRYQTIL